MRLGFDLGDAVIRCADQGWARIERLVDDELRTSLLAEVEMLPFERLDDQVGTVTQAGEFWMRALPIGRAAIEDLALAVSDGVVASAVPGTAGFEVNEVAGQRHQGAGDGISWHRDQSAYAVLVAIVTLEGEALFEIKGGPDQGPSGPLSGRWETAPGDLVLLRGPGLGGASSANRPRHRIAGPRTGIRTTLTLRQNTQIPGTWPT